MRAPELLVPAGSLEVLKIAVVFGADAVYIGGRPLDFGPRQEIFPRKIWQRGLLLPMPIM